MKALLLARREWKVAFDTPIAYVVLALFPAVTGAFFWVMGPFFDENIATMRRFFEILPLTLVIVAPALTMRMWAEERRSGTEEILFSFPLRVRDLVLGKFLGAWGLLGLALALTLATPLTISGLGNLDWGPVVGGYLGSMLLGAACIAVGLWVSALTRNQIVAWLVGAMALLMLNLVGNAAFAESIPQGLGRALIEADFSFHFRSMSRGVVDLADLIFYGAVTTFFLSLNGLAIERRRWEG